MQGEILLLAVIVLIDTIIIGVLLTRADFEQCKHKWEVHMKADVSTKYTHTGVIESHREVLICKECGKVKNIQI